MSVSYVCEHSLYIISGLIGWKSACTRIPFCLSGPASAVDIDISEANNNNTTFDPSASGGAGAGSMVMSLNKYKLHDYKKDANLLMSMLMETQHAEKVTAL